MLSVFVSSTWWEKNELQVLINFQTFFVLLREIEENFSCLQGIHSAEMLQKLSLLTPVGFSSLETGYRFCIKYSGLGKDLHASF